eukprot:CAMPEP_0171173380 /NCGR_PEP_ID=MMETSP0790-20130122/10193_1 /TAXON_ID=2925 /ORGANISM="Alexandrium catenella, Strain OF101" /LENGTH=64 /DNA_ID=CAMNT_0011638243 /DNA_START=478 /DNA_END=668 /DNA_ORIENTATION=+
MEGNKKEQLERAASSPQPSWKAHAPALAARLGAAPGAEAASSASTAMGTPLVVCSLPARRRAAA